MFCKAPETLVNVRSPTIFPSEMILFRFPRERLVKLEVVTYDVLKKGLFYLQMSTGTMFGETAAIDLVRIPLCFTIVQIKHEFPNPFLGGT